MPAVLNLLGLNYNNFLDVNEGGNMQVLDKDLVKGIVNREESYKKLLPENIRMLAVELTFI